MDFTVHAQGQGKIIRVYDRMAGTDAFNKFLDADQIATVTVGSADGATGDIDLYVQMSASAPVNMQQNDYKVAAGEQIEATDE
jgi:hypothetical protein